MVELFEGFTTYDWAACPQCLPTGLQGYVYVFVLNRDELRIPFYVGQTASIIQRVGDYQYKAFFASTDFKVGEAIEYLTRKLGCTIEVLIKDSASRKVDERSLIRELQISGVHLLNSLLGYNYKTANVEDERRVIERYCDMLVHQAPPVNLSA